MEIAATINQIPINLLNTIIVEKLLVTKIIQRITRKHHATAIHHQSFTFNFLASKLFTHNKIHLIMTQIQMTVTNIFTISSQIDGNIRSKIPEIICNKAIPDKSSLSCIDSSLNNKNDPAIHESRHSIPKTIITVFNAISG